MMSFFNSMFVDPATNDVYQENDTLALPLLGATLRVLQTEPDAMYNGSLATQILEDLAGFDSIITADDLLDFGLVHYPIFCKTF